MPGLMVDVVMLISVLLTLVDCEGRSLLGRPLSLSDCIGVRLLPDDLYDAGVLLLVGEDLDRVSDNVRRVLLLSTEVPDEDLSLDGTREDWSFSVTEDDLSFLSGSAGDVPL